MSSTENRTPTEGIKYRLDGNPRRRGAIRPSMVPAAILGELEGGRIETVNLMEQIALDLEALASLKLPEAFSPGLSNLPFKSRMLRAGLNLAEVIPSGSVRDRVRGECDTVRAIGALAIGLDHGLAAEARVQLLLPFADDPHFGVREWSWIGLRESLRESTVDLMPLLKVWARSERANVRRFATEITRPRGVWTPHLHRLKESPQIGQLVLDSLMADPDRYVQTSVGNWLNDAGVSRPEWVLSYCARWQGESAQPSSTARIVRLAQRGSAFSRSNQPSASATPSEG